MPDKPMLNIISMQDETRYSIPYALRALADSVEKEPDKPYLATIVMLHPDGAVGLFSAGKNTDPLRNLGALQMGIAALTDIMMNGEQGEA